MIPRKSVLGHHNLKKTRTQGGKAQVYKKLEIMQPKINRISPHEVLQTRLVNTDYHLLVKNHKGGRKGLKERRWLISFLLLKRDA